MDNLIYESEKFVVHLLNNKLDNKFVYHNLAHTQRVVEKAKELAELAQISELEKTHLILSAWLHDTGFTVKIENHEDESAKIATTFLTEQGCSNNDIEAVCNLILATNLDSTGGLSGQVLQADGLGASSFVTLDADDIEETNTKKWDVLFQFLI